MSGIVLLSVTGSPAAPFRAETDLAVMRVLMTCGAVGFVPLQGCRAAARAQGPAHRNTSDVPNPGPLASVRLPKPVQCILKQKPRRLDPLNLGIICYWGTAKAI